MGWNRKQIASVLSIDKKTVTNIRHCYWDYGDVVVPESPRKIREDKIFQGETLKKLHDMLLADPLHLLDEIADALRADDIEAHISTICRSVAVLLLGNSLLVLRAVHELGFTHKKVKKIAQEARILEERKFLETVNNLLIDPEQLGFIDEVGINDKCGNRYYGYAPCGERVAVPQRFVRGDSWNVVAFYSVEGVEHWEPFEKPPDAETFNAFFREHVLPWCNAWPGPCSIIILDNASIHSFNSVCATYNTRW